MKNSIKQNEIHEKIEMRKIIPVVARISAGKSKLLNVIYNINFLESKAGISTKFINLLRYNPNIKELRFFHLKIKKKGEKYEFYNDTDYNIIIGEENIIKENKNLNMMYRNAKSFEYEDIFYMTEINNSPFIKDENYLLTHDLCDVPGLSEAQKEIEEKNEIKINIEESNKEKSINEEIKMDNEISKIEDKKEDEIYYHVKDEKNTYLSEVFKIMKDYIDGGIIILSVENYYFVDNFELISKFHKVLNKTISSFLIILNKIDYCLDETNQYIEKCKGLIMKYFPDCRTFNLNLNTFIPLSTIRLKEELLLQDDFEYLMKYHISNYFYRIKIVQKSNDYTKYIRFIDYLKEIIKLEERIDKIDKNEINALDDNKKNYIKNVLNKIENDDDYKKENINLGINYSTKNKTNNSNLDDDDIINYLYICHKEHKLIPLPSEETYNLINYFKTDKTILQTKEKLNQNYNNKDKILILKKTIVKNINKIVLKLKDLLNNEAYNIIEEDRSKLNDLENENDIFLPFLGPRNVGKSTIINGIIGEDIFPLNKPTQKIFIIKNADENEEINIRKVKLIKKQKLNGDTLYYFDFNNDYIIAKGLDKVKETIKGLNYEFIDKFTDKYLDNPENYFYLIRTKIKLFDTLSEIDENIKQKIYLVDFPGFGNTNEFQNFIESNILKMFNSFIFVLRESFINDYSYRYILWYIFNKAMEKKGKINQGFFKYCLFILNLDIRGENINNVFLNSYKNEIKSIINASNNTNEDNNFFFFNAESFYSNIKKHNYYFNIRDIINASFKTYCKIKYFSFKYPENYNEWDILKNTNIYSKKYDSFQKYFKSKILADLKETFKDDLPKKNQIINENVKFALNESIKDLEIPHYNIKVEFSESNKNILYKYFSFAQNKLGYSSILKNYNYFLFKNLILNLVSITNNELNLRFKINTDYINKKLSFIFNTSLIKSKKDDYNNFKIIIEGLINQISNFLEEQNKQMEQKKEESLCKIKEVLDSKKQGIIDKTLKGKTVDIKNVILEDITKEISKLNNFINNLFNNITGFGNLYFLEIKKALVKFLDTKDEKIDIEDIHNFKDFFYSIILSKNNIDINKEKDVIEEATNEIQIYFNNSISKIFDKKGFLESLKSIFSRTSYFSNFIEILNKYISDRITYILKLLSENLNDYIKDKIDLIKFRINLLAINHTDNEIKKIEELREEWNKILDINLSMLNLV